MHFNKFFNLILFCILFITAVIEVQAQPQMDWKKIAVLVYSKNGKGYVHNNIPSAVKSIQQIGRQHGFRVDTSSNPQVMREANLKQYRLVIFPSTNNDVFDTDLQRLAFRHYIEAGGGFVGIHSVVGTERNWKWFKMMLGGTFATHLKFQQFKVRIVDAKHPSVQGLPRDWYKEDEFYFLKQLYPGPKVIMANDILSLNSDSVQTNTIIKNAGGYTELYPSVWTNDFDGGYTWCTTLGHDIKDYSDSVFLQHIFNGIRYVASQVKEINYNKGYAREYDDAIQAR